MKVPRTVNRRDFHIEIAGYYTFLKPSTRFIAWHLRRVFPYLARQSKAIEQDPNGSPEMQELARIGRRDTADARKILRWVLIVVAAIAITLGWLYGSNVPWRHITPWPHR